MLYNMFSFSACVHMYICNHNPSPHSLNIYGSLIYGRQWGKIFVLIREVAGKLVNLMYCWYWQHFPDFP